jgi:hypothetical protein
VLLAALPRHLDEAAGLQQQRWLPAGARLVQEVVDYGGLAKLIVLGLVPYWKLM